MTTRELGKSKLARSIALGLTLGTSLYWGGVANAAATEYDAATVSDTSVTASYYDKSTGTYTTVTSPTVTLTGLKDSTDTIIKAGAQNNTTPGSGVLTISASNKTGTVLDFSGASISNGIVVTGSGNDITIGANTNTITFSGSAVDTNSVTVSGSGATPIDITNAKDVTVNKDTTVGNISSTATTVTVNGKTGSISATGSDVEVKTGATVNGTGTSDGISYTGYTAADPTKKSEDGGSVTVTGKTTVTGAQSGINYTNGNVTVTGTSSTQQAKVTGTAG